LSLERRGDVVRDRLGARARVIGLHLDDGIVHRRQVVHREPAVAEDPEQDHGDGQDRSHDRTADERLGEVHDSPRAPAGAGPVFVVFAGTMAAGPALAVAPGSTRTCPPGVTPSCPLTTTRSPRLTP